MQDSPMTTSHTGAQGVQFDNQEIQLGVALVSDAIIHVDFEESTYDSDDETFITAVHSAEIVAVNLGGKPYLTRGLLVEWAGSAVVDALEAGFVEQRMELIG